MKQKRMRLKENSNKEEKVVRDEIINIEHDKFILLGLMAILIAGIYGSLYNLSDSEMMVHGLLGWLVLWEFLKI